MKQNWLLLIGFILVIVTILILLIRKNHTDRKHLFKKLPGDYPDPRKVESEFDSVDK